MALIITANGSTKEETVLNLSLEARAAFFTRLIPGEIATLRLPDGRVMLHVPIKDRRNYQRNKQATALAKSRLRADEYIGGTAIVITEAEAGVTRDLPTDETAAQMVIVAIDRRSDIEAKNVKGILGRLRLLSATREDLMRYQGKVSLSVSGYDNDPRELHLIPEVKRWFQSLDLEWPYWGWFLERDGDMFSLILALLCSVKEVRKEGQTQAVEVDTEDLPGRVDRLYNSMIEIGKERGVSAKDIQAAINTVHAVLQARIR